MKPAPAFFRKAAFWSLSSEKLTRIRIIAGLLCAASLLALTACSAKPPTSATTSTTSPEITRKGVGFTPRSFAAADFEQFFTLANQAGGLVVWSGDWMEMKVDSGAPAVLAQTAPRYGCTAAFAPQLFDPAAGALFRPLDAAVRENYKSLAVSFVNQYKPVYLALGVEVNILYEKSPSDFNAFVSFYNELYPALKAASPATRVFTILQLEHMKGLDGGLFGGVNDPSRNEWALLERFEHLDFAAFTTYPSLIYSDPSDLPFDYYTDISSHTNISVAFTETGWHASASPKGWESSEDEQARFVQRFFELTRPLNPAMSVWSFLYDQNAPEPFRSMGLLRADGNPRAALAVWTAGR